MDQDTLFQAVIFGGIYGISFFIVYLFGRNTAPKSALQYAVGSWAGLMFFVLIGDGPTSCVFFVVLFLASFLVFRQKAQGSLQAFFTANKIYKATTIPEQVSTLLGSQYYSCADVTLTSPSGEDIHFNWWQGMTSSLVKAGNAYVNAYTYYLAISFAPNTITEAFKQAARAKMDTSGFTFRKRFKHWFVLDTATPVRITETEDGSFVIIWKTYHDVERFSHYIDWLKANLFSKPAEIDTSLPLTTTTVLPDESSTSAQTDTSLPLIPEPEIIVSPVIPSSRHQHEQAVAQAPKLYAHSTR